MRAMQFDAAHRLIEVAPAASHIHSRTGQNSVQPHSPDFERCDYRDADQLCLPLRYVDIETSTFTIIVRVKFTPRGRTAKVSR